MAPRREGGRPGSEATASGFGAPAAARHLQALFAPIRFAARDGFAGLPRLSGFGQTLGGAVARARADGAPDSPALARLAAEAEGFDALAAEGRKSALGRITVDLGALVPIPEDLRELARTGRVAAEKGRTPAPLPAGRGEGRGEGRQPGAAPSPRPSPPAGERERRPGLSPSPPATAADRSARRRLLQTRLAELPGVHPAPRALLEERGHLTVEQALEFWPKAYQDRTVVERIAELRLGEDAICLGEVRYVRPRRMRTGKPMLEVGLADQSARLELVFFNPPPWRQKAFAPKDTLLCSGKVTEGFGGRRQMRQPEVEKLGPGDSANFGRIVPFYTGPADHQHPALRKLMKRLCEEYAPLVVEDLPAEVGARRRLPTRAEALREAHFPSAGTDVLTAAARATPAFRRLVFEELFFLQLALALRRRGVRREPGIAFDVSPGARARALQGLPFQLTPAQRKVLGEIAGDMGRPEPMNRLLQGDVGSGKTAVAYVSMMLAVNSGWQAALMAPTEILAEQHVRTLRGWLAGSGLELALVGARARGRSQREAREAVTSGRARIAVGTHALLEAEVTFEKLGLVVVDEQHRFGVLQRARLMRKGRRPDVLVMTATPIPRTLSLAFYGDLDQSKITGLPPGRRPVKTRVFGDSQRRKAYQIARREMEEGRQIYVVYPLVAESEKTDLADATRGAEELGRLFTGHSVGLVHGQMKPDDKEAVMARFRDGEVRVLVATTVIEVGVDVPNATVMIVEHAERFGLSQLHQLRGRVGRGAAESHCLLIAHFARAGDEARERLRVLVRSQDGFEVARADLKLRGPGELLGTRQSGQPLFEIADLYRDEAILDEAREEAFALVESDPELTRPEHILAAEALRQRWAGRLSLAMVG